ATDELGRTTRYSYDTRGNLTDTAFPGGGHASEAFDSRGAVIQYTDTGGGVARFTRDPDGNLAGFTDPLGRSSSVLLRSDGQIASDQFSVSGDIVRYSYRYTAGGALSDVTLPSGASSSVSYDTSGLPVRSTNSLGASQTATYGPNGDIAS